MSGMGRNIHIENKRTSKKIVVAPREGKVGEIGQQKPIRGCITTSKNEENNVIWITQTSLIRLCSLINNIIITDEAVFSYRLLFSMSREARVRELVQVLLRLIATELSLQKIGLTS